MARRKRQEEEQNHEAWAIPYGDLVTLLLAFFVVMYAMSSVNVGKYRVLSDSLNEAFNGTPRSGSVQMSDPRLQPINTLPRQQVSRMMAAGLPAHRLMPQVGATGSTATGQLLPPTATAQQPEQHRAGAPAAVAIARPSDTPADAATAAGDGELSQVADNVAVALGALVRTGQVKVRRYESWIAIDISSDILFASGDARLGSAATGALAKLADTIKPFPNAVRVEGYTDDRPIRTAAYPSNWELSAARAASVVHLFMDRGIAPSRLAVMGFGEFRPVQPNSDAANRNANRRVAVVVLGANTTPDGRQ